MTSSCSLIASLCLARYDLRGAQKSVDWCFRDFGMPGPCPEGFARIAIRFRTVLFSTFSTGYAGMVLCLCDL